MSYRRLSKKPLLFRSFTGLTVLEFDDVYKEIESKYEEYERIRRQHLSEDREKEKEKTQDHSRTYHMQDQEVWNNGY